MVVAHSPRPPPGPVIFMRVYVNVWAFLLSYPVLSSCCIGRKENAHWSGSTFRSSYSHRLRFLYNMAAILKKMVRYLRSLR